MSAGEDGLLRRVERRGLWLAALATGAALVAPGGGPLVAAGLLGGALLSILSYWAINRSITTLTTRLVAAATGNGPDVSSYAEREVPDAARDGADDAVEGAAPDVDHDAAQDVARDARQAATAADPSAPPEAGARGGRASRGLVMFVVRHALLAGMAYVMIARLRLPPVALLGGASVIVLAAAAELLRRRRPH